MIKTSCNKNLKLYLLWTSHLDPDLLSSIKKTVNNDFCRSMALEACLLDLADIKLKIHFDPISPFGHLQGWVLLPRIVLGWKEGIGCSPPLRRTDPVIVLFYLKVKVKVISCFYFVIKEISKNLPPLCPGEANWSVLTGHTWWKILIIKNCDSQSSNGQNRELTYICCLCGALDAVESSVSSTSESDSFFFCALLGMRRGCGESTILQNASLADRHRPAFLPFTGWTA